MRFAHLVRLEKGDAGTFGVFALDTGEWFYSMECPDRDNKSCISSIPLGEYFVGGCGVRRTHSPRYKRPLYLVENVPGGRTGIRIHAATWGGDKALGYRSHLQGCIALGMDAGTYKGQAAVFHSSRAVAAMTSLMQRQPFKLIIQEGF